MTAVNKHQYFLSDTYTPATLLSVPSVEIFTPSADLLASDPQELFWDVLFEWNQNVEFELSDIQLTGCTAVRLDGSGRHWTLQIELPAETESTAEITVARDSVEGPETTGPDFETTVSFDYNTAAESVVTGGQLCSLIVPVGGFRNELGIVTAVFNGVLSLAKNGNFLYFVVHIQNQSARYFSSVLDSRSKQGSAQLYRVDISQNPCVWTLLKSYKSVTLAARSLVIRNNRVYFFEGSHYSALNEGLAFTEIPVNSEDRFQHFIRRLDGVDSEWKGQLGRLMSISNTSSIIEDHGINWISATPQENPAYDGSDPTNVPEGTKTLLINGVYYSIDINKDTSEITKIDESPDRFYGIHTATTSPMVDTDDGIIMVTGYGNLMRTVDFRNDSEDLNANEVARFDNWHMLRYGHKHEFRSYHLKTNDRTYHDVFTEFARDTYSSWGFKNDAFSFKPRDPRHVIVNQLQLTDTDTSQIIIDKNNHDIDTYPSTGNVCINNEVLSYSSFNAANFIMSGLSRGLYNSEAREHAQNDRIYWIDHVIQLDSDTIAKIIQTVNTDNDIANIKNHITIRYGDSEEYIDTDDTSIERYGKRELAVDTSINRNELERVKWLALQLKNRYAKLNRVLDAELDFAPYLEVGDCIYFQCQHRMFLETACQVLEREHKLHDQKTIVKFVTL
ncbi:MAG: hypothetical protein F4039_08555 [Gammaproteobacteria bacterium]|nr:hypothetical protein [Gammaproteobacteria bacterium]MYK44122.1 hypothetical protein [Gammaproteobacteria bacterium]